MYNVYKDGEKVATTESNAFQFNGLESDTEYTLGVSRVIDGRESDVVSIKARTEKAQEAELTVPEIKELLDERGIEYPSSARKAELIELLGE